MMWTIRELCFAQKNSHKQGKGDDEATVVDLWKNVAYRRMLENGAVIIWGQG